MPALIRTIYCSLHFRGGDSDSLEQLCQKTCEYDYSHRKFIYFLPHKIIFKNFFYNSHKRLHHYPSNPKTARVTETRAVDIIHLYFLGILKQHLLAVFCHIDTLAWFHYATSVQVVQLHVLLHGFHTIDSSFYAALEAQHVAIYA